MLEGPFFIFNKILSQITCVFYNIIVINVLQSYFIFPISDTHSSIFA